MRAASSLLTVAVLLALVAGASACAPDSPHCAYCAFDNTCWCGYGA
jgi:hypothetical protein